MSWQTMTLGDVVTLKRGHDLPERDRREGPIPIVSSSGVTGFHNVAKAEPPGVVTGRYGTLGEVYFINEPYWPLNTSLYAIDFHENDPKFVSYFLRQVLKGASSNSKAAVPGVNRNDLHALRVTVPERDVQERVAEILSVYDDLIQNNQRRIKLLEEAARLIYREWFVRLRFPGHELTKIESGIPQGWVKQPISELCETIGGGTPSTKSPEYWDGDIPWVVPSDVTKNSQLFLPDTARKITEAGLRASSAKMLPANSILMSSRASVGYFAIVDRPVCTNQGFISIVPHRESLRLYMLFALMSRVEEIRSLAGGTTFPEISKSKFREMQMVVPAETQLTEFQKLVGPIVDQIRVLSLQAIGLVKSRDLLLPRLMSGRIEV